MAAAYAALLSLTTVLERTLHPTCPVSLDKLQIQSLLDRVSILVQFLENYSQERSIEMQNLERKMASTAYAAEDTIESCVVNAILATVGEGPYVGLMCPHHILLYPDLQKSIQEMDDVIKEAMEIQEKKIEMAALREMGSFLTLSNNQSTNDAASLIRSSYPRSNHQDEGKDIVPLSQTLAPTPTSPLANLDENADIDIPMCNSGSFPPPRATNTTVVGLDEQLRHLIDRLTIHKPSRVVIPIVGMGGIGKSTLANKIYAHSNIVRHFDVRAWVTISQHYTVGTIIRPLLHDIGVRDVNGVGDEQLGDRIHKGLFGRRYLIILDDIWSSQVWRDISRFFPDNNNGSRILFTTRLSSVADSVGPCSACEMKLLDGNTSLKLLCTTIFGEEVCQPELERLGMEIAKSCKGLPLAIVVIGGLLKISRDIQYWENIAKNVKSILSTENYRHCLEILSLSYNHLPVHLKPCFLYVAMFEEDSSICVSDLIMLWVAEGFLRPIKGKILEDVAFEYLIELIDRNLIIVQKRGLSGEIKECRVHDLLREFCLREAQKESFLCLLVKDSLKLSLRFENERRFVYPLTFYGENNPTFPSVSHARSLIGYHSSSEPFLDCKLLRIMHLVPISCYAYGDVHLVNLRYLQCKITRSWDFFSSISLFWNLETLIASNYQAFKKISLPNEFWDLPYIRHVILRRSEFTLPDPTRSKPNCVLKNLQTLVCVKNFNCSDEVLHRIPNLKKLKIVYDSIGCHSFLGLSRFHKLEKLKCRFQTNTATCILGELANFTLPRNLKRLTLRGSNIPWENMSTVGSLPNLQVLKLEEDAFCGHEWNPIEGEFQRLKHLSIKFCALTIWRVNGSHFPRLEGLRLHHVYLEDIPLGIGELSSIESICLRTHIFSHVISAKTILDERLSQGNDDLLLKIEYYSAFRKVRDEVAKLATDNFQVNFYKDYWEREAEVYIAPIEYNGEGEAEGILGSEQYNKLMKRIEEALGTEQYNKLKKRLGKTRNDYDYEDEDDDYW